MSAYLLYQNCYREQFKSLNPGITFGQLAKYTSYMYKVLPVEEKQRWEAHAAQDKARYEAEMTAYTPPPGYDSNGNLVEDRRLNKKYIKRIKDPEQPKRARGSFVFFSFEEVCFLSSIMWTYFISYPTHNWLTYYITALSVCYAASQGG